MAVAVLLSAALPLSACAGGAFEVAVEDHPAVLTADAGETLFVLTLIESGEKLPLAELKVSAALPGVTQTVINYVHDDKDGDGAFSLGDSLTCKEPPLNLFGPEAVGQEVRVLLLRDPGGQTLKELTEVRWTPLN